VNKYGFWVDLGKRRLFDVGSSGWLHALPIGTYEHPVYGQMQFTPEKVAAFAASVNNKIRGIDPDIDYEHKDKTTKAAGWVKAAEARADGLHLKVDWTKAAADAIKAGEYRYFSPEFDDEWTDASGVKHTNVLFGGALTNRPYLKDLLPVNLSEITTQQPQGGTLDPKQLRAALKLSETATDDEVMAAIAKLNQPSAVPTPTPAPTQLTEDALAKMLTDLPAFKALQEGLVGAQKALSDSEKARQLSETKHRLGALQATQGGRKYVLPPSMIDAVAEGSTLADPTAATLKFVEGLEAFMKTGMVELGERGTARTGNLGDKNATQQLSEQVVARQTSHFQATGKTLSYRDAIAATVRDNPDLYTEYRQDSYAGKEES